MAETSLDAFKAKPITIKTYVTRVTGSSSADRQKESSHKFAPNDPIASRSYPEQP